MVSLILVKPSERSSHCIIQTVILDKLLHSWQNFLLRRRHARRLLRGRLDPKLNPSLLHELRLLYAGERASQRPAERADCNSRSCRSGPLCPWERWEHRRSVWCALQRLSLVRGRFQNFQRLHQNGRGARLLLGLRSPLGGLRVDVLDGGLVAVGQSEQLRRITLGPSEWRFVGRSLGLCGRLRCRMTQLHDVPFLGFHFAGIVFTVRWQQERLRHPPSSGWPQGNPNGLALLLRVHRGLGGIICALGCAPGNGGDHVGL
mmetsp:Transcript_51011/g.116122  ORF Transcript_51011/g.116122 Transcript_51011/m.116122 type:complete len:260 (-) Transcript_51011:524-1303(-)